MWGWNQYFTVIKTLSNRIKAAPNCSPKIHYVQSSVTLAIINICECKLHHFIILTIYGQNFYLIEIGYFEL